MARFDLAIGRLLSDEGGLTEDPLDHGGITKYGISLRWLLTKDPTATADTIRNLTQQGAADLYQKYWWHFDGIMNQQLADKVFDATINMGHTAIKILQSLVGVSDDGVYGPMTEKAINVSNPGVLLGQFRTALVNHYMAIIAADPTQAKFKNGWLRRARS